MKVLFMGTPDFSVPVLEGLIASKENEVVGVVTQPDRPKGRGGKLSITPVKEVALREQLPVFSPVKIKEAESVKKLREWDFDVIVVVAFGQLLSKEILDMPKYGCINVHASLLPRWRGAGPIQWSILAGDEYTGITTMQMDVGLDTGDILLTKKVKINKDETGGSLFDRLSLEGSDLLLETLRQAQNHTLEPMKQDDEKSTYAKMLHKDMGELDFTKSAIELERYVRGLNPWPSAYTHYKGKTLKIWKASVSENVVGYRPGQIAQVDKESFSIQTGEGCLVIYELQLEGKKRMKAEDFLRGVSINEGDEIC